MPDGAGTGARSGPGTDAVSSSGTGARTGAGTGAEARAGAKADAVSSTGAGTGPGAGTGAPLPLLLDAVLGVGSERELRTTLQHIVDTATELTDARYGALGVLDPERGRLTELFTAGLTGAEREQLAALPEGCAGVLGALADGTRPQRLADLGDGTPPPRVADPGAADPRSSGVPPGHPPTRAFLGVPIRVHTEVFGNLCVTDCVTDRRGGAFTDEDLALLRVLASQAGIAIGNARLYETARRRERWIEGAAAVTTSLLTGDTAADALMTVAERARLLADAAAGVVLQPTPEGGMEIVAASAPDDPGDIVGTTIAPGSPVLVQLLGGEPVFIEDSATDPRMTTHVRTRFGPSMMLPLQSGGKLIGTLALPRRRGAEPYSAVDRLLAAQFASQAALALVLADAQHNRERLAVYEDRDRIARDLHDLVVQRLFATEMMLESTRRRAAKAAGDDTDELLTRAVDELDSTIQEVRTAIFALQQPPADAPTTVRGRVLRETDGAGALLGFRPSVRFEGAVDTVVGEPAAGQLVAALRTALAAAHRRPGVSSVEVLVDATAVLPDGRAGVRLEVTDDGTGDGSGDDGARGTTVTWQSPV